MFLWNIVPCNLSEQHNVRICLIFSLQFLSDPGTHSTIVLIVAVNCILQYDN